MASRKIAQPINPSEDPNRAQILKFRVEKFLFDKQLDFVMDQSPFKIAVCSRRAGKTVACAAHLIHTALNNPGVNCWYLTLNERSAERIIWKDLKNILKLFNIEAEVEVSKKRITFPNDSVIYISGAHNEEIIENFRGVSIKLCYIDECQSFKSYIKDLIDDVIAPALIDNAGSLCLIGTPGAVPVGYFYECWNNEAWAKYHWTFWDNPHIPLKSGRSHEDILNRELKRRGVTKIDPSIQREWFGKWIADTDSLLIKYDKNINDFKSLPERTKFNYVMGVDIGHEDADAICILAWSESSPNTYLVEEMIKTKQDITALAEQIQAFRSRYEISKIVMDMGALGKKIGEEIIRRWQIPVEAADKTRKMENVALLNDALRTGRFLAKASSTFAEDAFKVEIDRDKSTPDRTVISDRFHSDIIDATLYAFKLSPAYSYTPPLPKPKYGSKEWAESQQLEMFDKELEGLQKEEELSKGYFGDDLDKFYPK